jgi:hypothetical protein
LGVTSGFLRVQTREQGPPLACASICIEFLADLVCKYLNIIPAASSNLLLITNLTFQIS